MSQNKSKYFSVTTEQVIKANSKTDALQKAQRRRGVQAKVLGTRVDGERIPATTAHEWVETTQS